MEGNEEDEFKSGNAAFYDRVGAERAAWTDASLDSAQFVPSVTV